MSDIVSVVGVMAKVITEVNNSRITYESVMPWFMNLDFLILVTKK